MHKRAKIRDVVKLKGGAAKVAALCGVTSASVSQWSAAGSIPVKHARTLAREWGCDEDVLHNPWGWRAPLLSDSELTEALAGYDDPFGPVEIDPDGIPDDDDDTAWIEPVREEKQGWTNEELEAILRGEEP